VGKVLAKVPNL